MRNGHRRDPTIKNMERFKMIRKHHWLMMVIMFVFFRCDAMCDQKVLCGNLVDDEEFLYQSILDLSAKLEDAINASYNSAESKQYKLQLLSHAIEHKMHQTAKLLEVLSVYNRSVDGRYKDQYSLDGSTDDKELQDFLRLRQTMIKNGRLPMLQGENKETLIYLSNTHGRYLRSLKLNVFEKTLGLVESYIDRILMRRQSPRIRETMIKEIKNRNNKLSCDVYSGVQPASDHELEDVCVQLNRIEVNKDHGVASKNALFTLYPVLQERKNRLLQERRDCALQAGVVIPGLVVDPVVLSVVSPIVHEVVVKRSCSPFALSLQKVAVETSSAVQNNHSCLALDEKPISKFADMQGLPWAAKKDFY